VLINCHKKLRCDFTIIEAIVRFNRGKLPDQVRKAIITTREKERVKIGKRMMRCTESDCCKKDVQNGATGISGETEGSGQRLFAQEEKIM
jgi:hypothetical protein